MMYSPKIAEDLVSRMYHLAKARKIPMTRFVDKIIREGLVVNDLPVPDARTLEVRNSTSEPRSAAA
jgi:hypothetical protein